MKTLNDLREVVTHFSLQLEKIEHASDVTIAGKITSVQPAPLPLNEGEPTLYSFMLDDYIGETRVYISQEGYEEFRSLIEPGQFVRIDGVLNVIDRMPQKECSVVAYDMSLLQ